MLNTGHSSQNIYFHLLDSFLHAKTFLNVHVNKGTVVRTYDLENSLTLDGGQLKFGYSLENGGSTVSNVKMTIDVEVL